MTAELTFAEVRRAVIVPLERAADTLRRLPMPRNGRPALERSSWPMMPVNPDDACGQASSRAPRLPPGPRAISGLDSVLPWLRALDNTDRQLVWARSGCRGHVLHASSASMSDGCAIAGTPRSIASSPLPCMTPS